MAIDSEQATLTPDQLIPGTNTLLRSISKGRHAFDKGNPPNYIMQPDDWSTNYLFAYEDIGSLIPEQIQKKALAELARAAISIEIAHHFVKMPPTHDFSPDQKVTGRWLEKNIIPQFPVWEQDVQAIEQVITGEDYQPSYLLNSVLEELLPFDSRWEQSQTEETALTIKKDIIQGSIDQMRKNHNTLPYFLPIYLRGIQHSLKRELHRQPTLLEFQRVAMTSSHIIIRGTKMSGRELLKAYVPTLTNFNPGLSIRRFLNYRRYGIDTYYLKTEALQYTEGNFLLTTSMQQAVRDALQTMQSQHASDGDLTTNDFLVRRRPSIRNCPAGAHDPGSQTNDPSNLIEVSLMRILGIPPQSH